MRVRKYKNGTITFSQTKGDEPGGLRKLVETLADIAREKEKERNGKPTKNTRNRSSK